MSGIDSGLEPDSEARYGERLALAIWRVARKRRARWVLSVLSARRRRTSERAIWRDSGSTMGGMKKRGWAGRVLVEAELLAAEGGRAAGFTGGVKVMAGWGCGHIELLED
jgi:hypothetical protein